MFDEERKKADRNASRAVCDKNLPPRSRRYSSVQESDGEGAGASKVRRDQQC